MVCACVSCSICSLVYTLELRRKKKSKAHWSRSFLFLAVMKIAFWPFWSQSFWKMSNRAGIDMIHKKINRVSIKSNNIINTSDEWQQFLLIFLFPFFHWIRANIKNGLYAKMYGIHQWWKIDCKSRTNNFPNARS